jgi:enoyl-CoA hydratase/carnithine racemase
MRRAMPATHPIDPWQCDVPNGSSRAPGGNTRMPSKSAGHRFAFASSVVERAGIPSKVADAWLNAMPRIRNNFRADSAACSKFWTDGAQLLARLPAKPKRGPDHIATAAAMHVYARDLRDRFLSAHATTIYDRLTSSRQKFVRAADLVREAVKLVPGLTPAAKELAAEAPRMLADKEGLEIDQGLFLSHVLADPAAGQHLCHAMLLPLPGWQGKLRRLVTDGSIDLGGAAVMRSGKASLVEIRRPRFLNAMDYEWLADIETAVDLAILNHETEICVLRGGVVDHRKHQRVFSSGINLTLLYQGKIPYLFYIDHLLGFEHKMFRGLARPDAVPDDSAGMTVEKAWIGAVDSFAIGGGCQHLLVMDYVLAANDAYLTLPARKEGIIPGAANLRLPRFVGDRIARQAIMYGRRLDCDSAEGRLICDEVVPPDEMDRALARVIEGLTSSGVVSMVSNRRGLRLGQEPLDLFRRYLAFYAREQAVCHFSPILIANLERHWDAAQRTTP